MTATSPDSPAQLLASLVPELARLDERAAKLEEATATAEAYKTARQQWEADRRAALLSREPLPPEPAAPYGDVVDVARLLLEERIAIQKERRRLLREHAREVLAALEAQLQPTVREAAPLVRKLEALAGSAATATAAANVVREALALPLAAPVTAATLVRGAQGGAPLLEQLPQPEPAPVVPADNPFAHRVSYSS